MGIAVLISQIKKKKTDPESWSDFSKVTQQSHNLNIKLSNAMTCAVDYYTLRTGKSLVNYTVCG